MSPHFLNSAVTALRPKQWTKNFLVFAAPFAAGTLFSARISLHNIEGKALLALVIFCCLSSIGYLFNDWIDRVSDSNHPTKSFRPIAAGRLSGAEIVFIGFLLTIIACSLVIFLGCWFIVVAVLYLLNTCSYSMWVKNIAVIELFSVAMGFLLRPIAGAVATNTPISSWFLFVSSFAALSLVTAKRHSEFSKTQFPKMVPSSRKVIAQYSLEFLRSMMLA
jgi:decaprenyl-phosphate phosphoribosyltransferase